MIYTKEIGEGIYLYIIWKEIKIGIFIIFWKAKQYKAYTSTKENEFKFISIYDLIGTVT
jgi:hypothetical protein